MLKREMHLMPIESLIDYWRCYWPARVNELEKAENLHNCAKSPRVVLENIIAEIKYNDPFKGKKNRELFKSEISSWMHEPVFNSLFREESTLLMKDLDAKPLTASSICTTILSRMNTGIYFKGAINKLVECLEKENDFSQRNKKNIHMYSDILIVELLSKGYSIRDIKNATDPQSVIMQEHRFIINAPDELWGFRCKDYDTKTEYIDTLSSHFSALSVADKVNLLQDYYDAEGEDAYIIIRLKGIKGEIDSYIDDINIYSVGNKRYIDTTDCTKNIETPDPNHTLINVAVPVKLKSYDSSKDFAIKRLESIISLLELRLNIDKISYSNKDIALVKNKRLICTFNPTILTFRRDSDSEFEKVYYSEISYYDESIKDLSDRLSTSKKLSSQDLFKLSTASNWIQKAKSTKSHSDRLLYSWIAIEGLLKIRKEYTDELNNNTKACIGTAVNTVLMFIVERNLFYNRIFQLLGELQWNFESGCNRLGLSDDIKTKLFHDNTAEGVPMNNLFICLEQMTNEVIEESFRTKLEEFNDLYKIDGTGFKRLRNTVTTETTYIYWFRNMIMHNAFIPKYHVKYYANRALFYASCLTNAILSVSTTNQLCIDDTIMKIALDGELFEANLTEKLKALRNGCKKGN